MIKNEGSPLLAQNEVRADIFLGSLAENLFPITVVVG
jgi:hypothetical protein